MSEDHARLFASTVPGNGSSSTLGLNVGGRNNQRQANPVGQTGNEWESESVAPREAWEHRHNRPDTTPEDGDDGDDELNQSGDHLSRPIDQNPQIDELDGEEKRNPEDKSIEYMDDVVDSFRRKEISKLKALSNIISILNFNPSRTEEAKDAAVEYYAKTLDEVEAIDSSAVKRGRHAQIGLQPNQNRLDEHCGSKGIDKAIDDLVSQVSRESNMSKRGQSPSDSDNGDDFDKPSNKKCRVFESEMPWCSRRRSQTKRKCRVRGI